jgi:hypothetical protein
MEMHGWFMVNSCWFILIHWFRNESRFLIDQTLLVSVGYR